MASCILFYIKWFLLFLHLILVNGEISDLRLCANPSCDEPVSHAKTLIKYIASDKHSLTFLPNAEVVVYSKSAGNVPHLWGGAINGKRGYFPSKFVREYKVLTSHLPYAVPTEKGLIAGKQLELNDSNKELPTDTASSLSKSDVKKEMLNIKDENSRGKEYINRIALPNTGNSSDIEITQEIGINSGPKSAAAESVSSKATPDQKSTIELVMPTKSVSETEMLGSEAISSNGQAISPSKRDHLNLHPSAFSASPFLTNVVAHTKEVTKNDDHGLLNSAVWVPEKKEPSRSFFGHGVSADSSIDENASGPNENLLPELESWVGVTASTSNENYVMVEGTQIPVHEDEEPDTTALPTMSTASLSIPSVDSLIPTTEHHLPGTSDGNSATANSEAVINNAQLSDRSPSMTTISPAESASVAEASLSQSGYLPLDHRQTLNTRAIVEQTAVEDKSILAEANGEKSTEQKPDPRATEIGDGGEVPALSANHKESEKGSGSETLDISEGRSDEGKADEALETSEGKSDGGKVDEAVSLIEIRTTVEQQDAKGEKSVGWYAAMKTFVTLEEEVQLNVPPVDDDKKASETITTSQFQANEQNNDGKQDITRENAALDGLEKDDDDYDDDDDDDDEEDHDNDPANDPGDENTEDSAEGNEIDLDHDILESRKQSDLFDANLQERSYHDRVVINDRESDSPADQSSEKPGTDALGDSDKYAKSYEDQTVMDQSKENYQKEISGSRNVKIFDHEHGGSPVNGDDSSVIKENTVNNIAKDESIANDGDSVVNGIRSDKKEKPLEEKEEIVMAYDKSVMETDESTEKDVFKIGEDDSVAENFESVTENGEFVTEKVESLTQAGLSDKHVGSIYRSGQSHFLDDENFSSNAAENVDASDFNLTNELSSKTLGENLEFQVESDQHGSPHVSNLPDDETMLVNTEPTFGVDESLHTPLPEDVVTTESSDMDLGKSVFSEGIIKKVDVEDTLGTCEGPGIDGACGSTDKIFVGQTETLEQQGFWESIAAYVSLVRSYVQAIIDLLPDFITISLHDLETSAVSPHVVVFVLIVGSFIFLLEISFIAIKTRYKEAILLGKISSLDQKLFTVTKERDILKANVESYVDKNMEGEYHKAQATIQALQAKLKMSQNDSGKLQNAVLHLQEQLNDQQKRFGEMQLASEATQHQKDELNDELQNVHSNYDLILQKYDEVNHELENVKLVKEGLQQLISSKDEEVNQLQDSNKQLLKEAEVWDESVKQLQININEDRKNIQEYQDAVTFKNNEIEALKDCLLKLKIAQGKADGDIVDDSEESSPTSKKDNILERLMDVSSIKAELKSVVDERDSILAKLEIQQNARLIAEEQVKKCLQEAERVQAEYDKANLEREAAQTKLNVLSNYFKEKELQLQKELGVQEAQRQQSQESVISVTQRIAMYEQETSLYKSQISSFKAEFESQERSYKTQLTAHEKKAHENWLAARAAERKLEESKQAAATLRNRLTLLEQEKASQASNQTDAGKTSRQSYPDNNGEVPSPPRLGPGDRSDSMDLPTSSRSSIFSREPLEILHGLPFLPPDRPLPPPFMRGLPPGGLLPPMDDRLPLPPFDPRRGMFPMHPPPPGPLVGGLPPEHWMGPRRRGSPPFDHPSHRERPSPPLLSQRSPPPFERRPPSSRNAVSPLESDSRDMGALYERDYRERTPPARFFDPPMRPGFGGLPPPTMRGPPNSRPPIRRDVYPPGRADGSIDPRTSSPMTPKQDGKGTTA